MNLDHMRYFLILSQEMHYSRAAQRLNISQSGLSHAIDSLEQELGVPLFQKSGRGIRLGRYGALLLPRPADHRPGRQLSAPVPDPAGRGGDPPAANHPPAHRVHRDPAVPAIQGDPPRL